jgi:hypothetical protein
MMKLQVQDNPSLERDSFSKALLSKNGNALDGYRAQREKLGKIRTFEERQTVLETKINKIESDLTIIRDLLIKAVSDKTCKE